MADFSDVVAEIKKTNSKLDKMVKDADPSGPVMAGEVEDKREELARENKQTSLLERIAKAVEKFGPGGAGADGKGKKGLNMMDVILGTKLGKLLEGAVIGGLLAKFGIGGLVVAALGASILAFKDGLDAWGKAEKGKWGSVDKVSAFIGGFFGGGEKPYSLWNTLNQTWKIGAMGGMAGWIAAGPPGMIAGFLIGAAIGAISGYFGSKKVADWIDSTVQFFRGWFDLPELLSDAQIKAIGDENAAIQTKRKSLYEQISNYNKIIKDADISNKKRVKTQIALVAAETELQQGLDKEAENNRRLRVQELAIKDKEKGARVAGIGHARLAYEKELQLATDAGTKAFWMKMQGGHSESAIKAQEDLSTLHQGNADRLLAHMKDLIKTDAEQDEARRKMKEDQDKIHGSYVHNFMMAHSGIYRWAQKSHKEEVSQVKADQETFKAFFEETLPNIWKTWVTDGHDRITKWNKIKKDQGEHKPAALYGDWDKFFDITLPGIWKTYIMTPIEFIKDWQKTADQGKVGERIMNFFSGFKPAKWFYDPGTGAEHGEFGAPARLFGIDMTWLHKMQDIGDKGKLGKTLLTFMGKLAKEFGDWVYTGPGLAGTFAEGGPVYHRGKIFGMEIPDFFSWVPDIDIAGKLKNLKKDLLARLPEWMTDPHSFIMKMWSDIEKSLPDFMRSTASITEDMSKADIEALIKKLTAERDLLGDMAPAGQYDRRIEKLVKAAAGKQMQMGGFLGAGDLALVGEGGRELFVSDRAGTILSAGLTRQIFSGMSGAGGSFVNAPTVVNAPQTNMSMVGMPIVPDNPVIRAVNASAFT